MNRTSVLSLAVAFAAATFCASTASAARILVDFGPGTTGTPTPVAYRTDSPVTQTTPTLPASIQGTYWNNYATADSVAVGFTFTALPTSADLPALSNLVDSTNAPTSVGLALTSVTGNFKTGNVGTQTSTIYPIGATRDHFIASGAASVFTLTLSGLDTSATYDLSLYAARPGTGTGRNTLYTVVGSSSSTLKLDASTNVDGVVTVLGVSPNSSTGTIDITVAPDTALGGTSGFISALDISYVPEPTSIGLLSLAGLALLRRRSA